MMGAGWRWVRQPNRNQRVYLTIIFRRRFWVQPEFSTKSHQVHHFPTMSTRQLLIYGARASRKGEAHRHRRALRVREVLLGPPLFEGFRLPVPKKKVSKRRNRRYINPAKTGYVCNLCNVVRSCRKALKAHIHSVHGPKPPKINQVRCAECYQIHERGAAYHNHLKKVHKIRFTRESKVFSSKAGE